MKFMKKISLFVALALVITVGGVYAAWVYPSDDAAVGTADKTFTGNMTQVSTSATSKGTISVNTASDTLKLFVDDGGAYRATPIAQGSVDILFTPLDGVSDTIANNGIEMVLTVSITGTQETIKDDENHDVKIFTVKTANFDLGSGVKQDNGTFKVTITGEQVLGFLNFCKEGDTAHNVTLDTLEENTTFGNALNTYTINLIISEKTTA